MKEMTRKDFLKLPLLMKAKERKCISPEPTAPKPREKK